MTDHREIVRPQEWVLEELPSLVGKTALVTGANTPDGVGFHVAHQLALKGAKVYVGARNAEKANNSIKLLLEQSPELEPALLQPFIADISNFEQVRSAARKLVSSEERLDILVNNAAVLPRSLDKNEHGVSVSFATNHLGPFLLTQELTPLLVLTEAAHPGVRIVNVASTSHYDVPEGVEYGSLDDVNQEFGGTDDPMSNYLRYGYSKLASIIHAKEMQRRFDEQGVDILTMSVHPGGIASNGSANYLGGRDNEAFRSSLSPFQGAMTPLFAAAHPEPAENRVKYAGSFLMPFGGLKKPASDVQNSGLAKQLWATSESVLDRILG